ncbi:unnamed protein product [Lupinus luteus]|uniref:Terpene synthase metal-binding domain-containing protein n=1 Tax=Lupinus luteus TaxID=3873 RepID=A0AAV1YM51_LUPLU
MSMSGRLLNDIRGFKRECEEGTLNAVSLHINNGNGLITKEDAIEEMMVTIEDKRRELLKLVLQEKGSVVPRECKELFWKLIRALNLFYIKEDGFSELEMHSTVNAVLKEPIVFHELLEGAQQNVGV